MSDTGTGQSLGHTLFALAKEADSLEVTSKELARIADLLGEIPESAEGALEPAAPRTAIHALLEVLRSTSTTFQRLCDEHQGVEQVGFQTAIELGDDMKATVEHKLRERYGPKIKVNFSVNRDIVAGFRLVAKGIEIDRSVAGQLRLMRGGMMETR